MLSCTTSLPSSRHNTAAQSLLSSSCAVAVSICSMCRSAARRPLYLVREWYCAVPISCGTQCYTSVFSCEQVSTCSKENHIGCVCAIECEENANRCRLDQELRTGRDEHSVLVHCKPLRYDALNNVWNGRTWTNRTVNRLANRSPVYRPYLSQSR